ncbi:hypothetical protein KC906_04015 [Candidatus Kaiserbacteria bacterium]|nr:hypothetical protein [Candidatus Kaiserbacteria bacterium]
MKDEIYAWLDELRKILPSEWHNSNVQRLETKKGVFVARRNGYDLILYPPEKFSRGNERINYLTFAVIPMDFSNQWIKPAYFDEVGYHGRADNWNNWWNYWFGKDE